METEQTFSRKKWVSLAVICIFLNILGFPGNYTRVFGGWLKPAVEYGAFFLELLLMLASSSDNVMEMKLIDLDYRFTPIYLFVLEVAVTSMISTNNRQEEIVTVFRLAVTACFAVWLARTFSVEELLRLLLYSQILFVAVSVAFPVLFSAYDVRAASYRNSFVGIGGVKNEIAGELSFGLIMQMVLYRIRELKNDRPGRAFFVFAAVQVILLILAKSAGAIITVLLIFAYIFIYQKRHEQTVNIGLVYLLTASGFIVLALTMMPLFEPLLEMIGKDPTLTGRIPLWRQMISVMQENKTFFGFGYGMFWRDQRAVNLMHAGFDKYSFMAGMTSGSHNDLLELLANCGIMGVASFFLSMLLSFSGLRNADRDRKIFCSAFVLYFTIHGLTERTWTPFQYMTLFLFISMAHGRMAETENAECSPSQLSSQPITENGI